jgi:hypothetical protein
LSFFEIVFPYDHDVQLQICSFLLVLYIRESALKHQKSLNIIGEIVIKEQCNKNSILYIFVERVCVTR